MDALELDRADVGQEYIALAVDGHRAVKAGAAPHAHGDLVTRRYGVIGVAGFAGFALEFSGK